MASSDTRETLFTSEKIFQIQADSSSRSITDNISELVTLEVPFIVGTPSRFLFRMLARSMTSSAISFGSNVSDVDFANTITWAGIDSFMIQGHEINDFTAVSPETNINWAEPFSA